MKRAFSVFVDWKTSFCVTRYLASYTLQDVFFLFPGNGNSTDSSTVNNDDIWRTRMGEVRIERPVLRTSLHFVSARICRFCASRKICCLHYLYVCPPITH